MKRLIIGLIGLGLVGGIVFWAARPAVSPSAAVPPAGAPGHDPVAVSSPLPADDPGSKDRDAAGPAPRPAVVESPVVAAPGAETKPDETDPFRQTMDLLLSAQTGLVQKRTVWGQLAQTGQLDRAIAELELRATNEPAAPEYPLALGEAYLFKIAGTEDVRDQAILGMKADQRFDAALKLDPSNWEAGFYKAAALARWPESMNKGAEVTQRLTDLIQRQEGMPSRPEFAATYVLLGEQYQKAGQPDTARQVWLRGAAVFPNSPSIQAKLATGP